MPNINNNCSTQEKMKKENKYLYEISIVIPVYNSSDVLKKLMSEIFNELDAANIKFETIFINDASEDKSLKSLEEIYSNYKNITIVNLKKNAGQDNAIMAGLKHVSGELILIMDDDLQHHPKFIIPLAKQINESIDVCYAKFPVIKQRFYKNIGSKFADLCANFLLKKPKNIYLSPFKILHSRIISAILDYDGPYPYIDGLILRVTRRISQIEVEHSKRFRGNSNYTFIKSIKVWAKLATNFSILPLRLSTYLGFFTAVCGFLLGVFYIVNYFFSQQLPPGWSSIIVLILFFGGIQLVALGLIGEYLGRLFLLSNKEPQYIIQNIKTKK